MTVGSVERGIVLPITKIGEEQACNKQANKQTFCYEQLLILLNLIFYRQNCYSPTLLVARLGSHDLFPGPSGVREKHFHTATKKLHATHLVLSQPLCLEKKINIKGNQITKLHEYVVIYQARFTDGISG